MDALDVFCRFGYVEPPDDDIVKAAVATVATCAAQSSIGGTGGRQARRLRGRRRRTVVVAGIVAAVAVPAAAAAATIDVNIGAPPFGQPGVTAKNPDQQYLNLDAPGIVKVVERLTKTVPLPPGGSWQPLLRRYPYSVAKGDSSRDDVIKLAGVGGTIESYARCQWEGAWLSAARAGNATAASRDAGVLEQATGWHYTVETFSPPALTALRRTASQAANGEVAPVAYDYGLNCSGTISPVAQLGS